MRVRGQNTWLLTPKHFAIAKAHGKFGTLRICPGGNEAECTGQEAEASAPHRQMGKGPNAVPQIFPFEL